MPTNLSPRPSARSGVAVAFAAAAIAGCAIVAPAETVGPAAKEEIVAVTVSNQLLRFNAGQPQRVRERRAIAGLAAGEQLVGIDYRVARGELYAVGSRGQLYKVDVARAIASPIGSPAAWPAGGTEWGIDFNPTVDRIRIVNDAGTNLRMHPDTGAVVDADPNQPGLQFDGPLAYDAGDANAGKPVRLVAAGYTYNKTNDRITTNFALDAAQGTLVHQGTKEGVTPAVSPNTGRLYTVGPLGAGRFDHATFDISDLSNTAYAGLRAAGASATRWYRVDLASGRAIFVGTVAGEPLVGAAIEP